MNIQAIRGNDVKGTTIQDFTYDTLGRLTRTSYKKYNEDGLVTQTLLNGTLVANNTYNQLYQLTNRELGNTVNITQTFDANGALLSIHAKKNKQERLHLSYTYDDLGRKTSEVDHLASQNTEQYSYDNVNRLTSWSRGSNAQSWSLDPLANWLSTTKNGIEETRTFDATNALLTQTVGNQTKNLSYDQDGNLANDGELSYLFDAFQRIVEVRDQNQNLVAKYQMDTSNRRISKTVGTTVHRTVYAGWQVAEEHETVPSGKKFKTTTKVYVYGQYIDEPLVMQITKPNGNQKKFWYLRNQQYSIYALTNDNGKIVETYHYSAYGEVNIEDPNGSTLTESAYSNSYFYTGRLLDSETNLYYFRNRYYNANQGRFTSRDPLGYVDGMSLYRGYFAVKGVDPLGYDDAIVSGGQIPGQNNSNSVPSTIPSNSLILTGEGGSVGEMFNLAANTTANQGDVIVNVTSGQAIISAIKSYLKKHCCVNRLVIFSHGGQNGVFVNAGSTSSSLYGGRPSSNMTAVAALVSDLNPSWFCKGATITLNACNTGNTTNNNNPIAQQIATQTGATVYGSTSGMSFTGIQNGAPGQGLPGNGSSVPANYSGNVYMVPDVGRMRSFSPPENSNVQNATCSQQVIPAPQ